MESGVCPRAPEEPLKVLGQKLMLSDLCLQKIALAGALEWRNGPEGREGEAGD